MPAAYNLVSPQGNTVSLPESEVAGALASGWRLETAADQAATLHRQVMEDAYGGAIGSAQAGALGLMRGATMGLSDVALGAIGDPEQLSNLREVNPGISTATEIVGAVAPAVVSGGAGAAGALARYTPTGAVTNLGAKIVTAGSSGGALTRGASLVGAGAMEGAFQNVGAYVSDVALGDKDLAADSFLAALGKGGLYGGAASGLLGATAAGITAARRMFPRQEITQAAVKEASREASRTISAARREGDELLQAARLRMAEAKAGEAEALASIRVGKAEAIADEQVITATMREEARRAKILAGSGRKTRKAIAEQAAATGPAADDVLEATGGIGPKVSTTADDLIGQLRATKVALDAGIPMPQLSQRPAIPLTDALPATKLGRDVAEAEVAQGQLDRWLEKYGGGEVAKLERKRAALDYADALFAKSGRDYSETIEDSIGGRSSGLSPRSTDRVTSYSDTPEVAAAHMAEADAAWQAERSLAERIAAGGDLPVSSSGRRVTAEEILDVSNQQLAERGRGPVDDAVAEAVRARTADLGGDVGEAVEVIGRYEEAMANLADSLGDAAPPAAAARAAAMREAQGAATRKTAEGAAMAADELAKATATISLGAAPPPAGRLGGVGGRLADIGSVVDALHMIGVPVPDPAKIPVIGPLLSVYLKARMGMAIMGRMRGGVVSTVEGKVAAKAARTREAVVSAVDKMLDVGAKASGRAAPRAGGIAAQLADKVFDDGAPGKRRSAGESDLAALYEARADELARSQQPGAIAAAVRQRLRVSDPDLLGAVVAAEERRLGYLYDKLPKPSAPQGLLSTRKWMASKLELANYAKIEAAVLSPVEVFQRAADGGIATSQEIEAVKATSPHLYQAARVRLMEQMIDGRRDLPYRRRVQLSVMFDAPLDPTMEPRYLAFAQDGYRQPPARSAPQMGSPTISGDVQLDARTSLDRP